MTTFERGRERGDSVARALLGEVERDEMAQVHGLRGGTTAGVEKKWLLCLVGVKKLVHVTAEEEGRKKGRKEGGREGENREMKR